MLFLTTIMHGKLTRERLCLKYTYRKLFVYVVSPLLEFLVLWYYDKMQNKLTGQCYICYIGWNKGSGWSCLSILVSYFSL